MRRRRDPPAVSTLRVSCPEPGCGVVHEVDRRWVGAHLWDVCLACLRKIDAETRRVLSERGVTLPYWS